MASCQTARWGSNNSSPYIKLTVTEKSSNETSATLSWSLQYIADYAASVKNKKEYSATIAGKEVASGYYDINGKTGTNTIASGTEIINKTKSTQTIAFSLSFMYNGSWSNIEKTELTASGTISVAAKTSYIISYNTNGGTGTFANQTKWHAENLTIHSGSPTKSGYTFKGWALTKAKADAGEWYYQPGATCGKNENLTLYAVWAASSYTVSYNANGGSGAPSSQTKSPNVDVTISNTAPIRSGYMFKGWSNAASSSTILYRPGDTYKTNASITLYAVWVSAPPPGITNFSVDRCTADGTLSENGEFAKVQFDWSINTDSTTVTVEVKSFELGSSVVHDYFGLTYPKDTESGTVNEILGTDTARFDTEKSYSITVLVTDSNNEAEASLVLGEAADSLEFMPGNKGVRFPKIVQGNVVGLSDLVVIPDGSDVNDYTITGAFAIKSNASAKTISNLPLQQAGRLFIGNSTGWNDPASDWDYLIQTFIPYLVSYPIYERHIRKTEESTWIYSPWVVITRNRHSMISAWPTSNITKTETGETQIPLQSSTKVGNGLTIEDNAIVIGQYITAVEVSAAGMINCASAANASAKNLYIRKEGSDVAISMNGSWSATKANFQLNVSPKLIEVKEGDKITFHWYASYNATNGGDVLQGVAARTYITVKEF